MFDVHPWKWRRCFLVAGGMLCGGMAAAQDFTLQQTLIGDCAPPIDVQVGDLDGDGDLDVVAASEEEDEICWYENLEGSGYFGPKRLIATAAMEVQSVHVADVDGDGDVDVLAATFADDRISWYRNMDGQGGFGSAWTITTAANGASSVFAADLDGDGDVDVISASTLGNEIAWYENQDGLGFFWVQHVISSSTSRARDVEAVDLDGDGDLDVLTAGNGPPGIAWHENTNGLGAFGPKRIVDPWAGGKVAATAADLDADGDPDLLVASRSADTVTWYENLDGLGGFSASRDLSTAVEDVLGVAAADLDGDGDLDVLAGAEGGDEIVWFENTTGLGDFAASVVISSYAVAVSGVVAGDLNGDGAVEVVAAEPGYPYSYIAREIACYEGIPGAGFRAGRGIDTARTLVQGVGFADVDGDGDLDAFGALPIEDRAGWFENLDGAGVFGSERPITGISEALNWMDFADVDGDGDLDLLATQEGPSGSCVWHENLDGQGTFTSARVVAPLPWSTSFRTIDVDGDGDLDALLWVAFDVYWCENLDGQGAFGPAVLINGATEVEPKAADLDGDGDVDLALYRKVSDCHRLVWHENTDGAGSFGPEQVIVAGFYPYTYPTGLAVGDLDGDGDHDLVWSYLDLDPGPSGFHSTSLYWSENDGFGAFTHHSIGYQGGMMSFGNVSLEDVDGDGDPDVVANYSGLEWYENTDGSGTFATPRHLATGTVGESADLDRDGDADFLLRDGWNGQTGMTWYRNDLHDAPARFRNAGANPASYTTSLPVLGWDLIGRVDLGGTTGHPFAWLAAYPGSTQFTFPGGQVLLIDALGPELFHLPFVPGPLAEFSVPVPTDPIYVGCTLSAQAVHWGGGLPWVLSNAFDFTLGN